jgi:DNA-binding MarR family transcriptional regulator
MPTEADTGAILDQLGRLLRTLTRQAGGADEDAAPMTATQRIALVELGDSGPLRLNDLAARIGTSPPTASRAVDALEELGFAERTVDPADRRAVRIELTFAGRRLLAGRRRRAVVAFEPAVAALSARDRAKLLALLERMTAELD